MRGPRHNALALFFFHRKGDGMEAEKKLVNAAWVARRLSICRTKAYAMAKGEIPCIKTGATLRFDPATVERWIREKEVQSQNTNGMPGMR